MKLQFWINRKLITISHLNAEPEGIQTNLTLGEELEKCERERAYIIFFLGNPTGLFLFLFFNLKTPNAT